MKHVVAFGSGGSFLIVIGLTHEDLLDLNEGNIPCLTAVYGGKRIGITIMLEDDQEKLNKMAHEQCGLVFKGEGEKGEDKEGEGECEGHEGCLGMFDKIVEDFEDPQE